MVEWLRWALWAALVGGSLAFRGPWLVPEVLLQVLDSLKPGSLPPKPGLVGVERARILD